MVEMHADDREELDSAQAGDIVALVGMKKRPDGSHPLRCQQPGDPGADGLPRSGHLHRVAPKDKAAPRRWASRSARWFRKTPPSASKPTRIPAKRILKGMGELHLDIKVDILKRTHSVELKSANRRLPTAKRSPRRLKTPTPTRSSPVVPVSSRKIDYTIEPGEPALGSSSNPKSSAVTFPRNTGLPSKKASSSPSTRGRSPAIPAWTSRSRSGRWLPRS